MRKEQENKTGNRFSGSGFKLRYLFSVVVAVLFVLAIFSYSPADLSPGSTISNYIGEIGAVTSLFFFRAVGLASYILAMLLLLWAIRNMCWKIEWERKFYWCGIVIIVLGAAILFAINPEPFAGTADKLGLGRKEIPKQSIPGGMIGQYLAAPGVPELNPPVIPGIARKYIGYVGTTIIGYIFLLGGILILYLSDWHIIVKALIKRSSMEKSPSSERKNSAIRDALIAMQERHNAAQERKAEQKLEEERRRAEEKELEEAKKQAAAETGELFQPEADEKQSDIVNSSVLNTAARNIAENSAGDPQINISVKGEKGSKSIFSSEYARPNINMLSKGDDSTYEDLNDINHKKELLQATLDSFKVDGYVSGHITGPRVTRYEVTLAPGVKVDRITSLQDNIKMNLEVKDIRILAPIPGKNAVGVEVPNAKSSAVHARSIMESDAWLNSGAAMPIILGKDISGQPVVIDLAKAPHLLIAGQTGSGKSVCMNTLIMSLLFTFSPDDLRLIMVDPKVVEFKDYEKIPHLITPILNDFKKVPLALRWAVNEMERRYRLIADAGVKDVKDFNKRPIIEGEVDRNGDPMPRKLPYIVIIIDELADLMLTEAKVEVESSINRITAKARAAAIHIVVATQRPSTKVITGNIKTNLPCRIAFKVTANVDSRVILDRIGAEMLLGKGDMLYTPVGSSVLERVQGAMVQDSDIKQVVNFISAQRMQEFNDSVLIDEEAEMDAGDGMASSAKYNGESRTELDDVMDDIISQEYAPLVQKYSQPGDDKLTLQALEIILSTRQASTSYLQRRLGIGYNRAANLIDIFEARGIIGPQSTGGNKRQILVFDEIDGE